MTEENSIRLFEQKQSRSDFFHLFFYFTYVFSTYSIKFAYVFIAFSL